MKCKWELLFPPWVHPVTGHMGLRLHGRPLHYTLVTAALKTITGPFRMRASAQLYRALDRSSPVFQFVGSRYPRDDLDHILATSFTHLRLHSALDRTRFNNLISTHCGSGINSPLLRKIWRTYRDLEARYQACILQYCF
jgi:hypothetical protein